VSNLQQQGPLDRLKQQTYVVIVFTGVIGSTLALLINELTGTISPFTRGIFVATISFLVLQVLLVHTKRLGVGVASGLLRFVSRPIPDAIADIVG
jgi:hypothetical protein